MANVMVKVLFHSTEKSPDEPGKPGDHLPVPAGAIKVRIQERVGSIGQDKDGNDTIVYTWKDIGQHRAAESGVHTELSKKQRLIVEIDGDI